ncbi:MAG TPA: SusC/RagA family TonB-linked outer membrane protein [Gemmatimonadaceae bacterium]|nr:SusC/RagA family TonB-linked outer membrane protein [Gemmatimonadaceae bacterium]
MRRLFKGFTAVCALALIPAWAAAQGGATISGRVTSDAGAPLPNASVFLQGTHFGALTGTDGAYSFTVPAASVTGQSATLTARLIGYSPASAKLTLSAGPITHDFMLALRPVQLQGLVVTALGLTREKSQLGTSQQQISSAELNSTHAQDFVNQLEGKVAGMTITGSGSPDGSTKITLRGANSISGNNDPLFIVDGIPVSNDDHGSSTRGGSLGGTNSADFGSAINDLNPDDIASVSVLKGPNAAALYGSRAANGVIVITTKHGQNSDGQLRTQLHSSYTWDTSPQYMQWQNLYGQGSAGNFQYVDGKGGGINDGYDQSYGPRMDGRPIDQFMGKQQPFVPHPGNVASFFNTGHNFTTTLAASGGTDRANARLSLSNANVVGVIPNNSFHKLTASLSGGLKFGSRFSTTGSVQYIKNQGLNRPGTGYNTSILEQFIWFGRQVDLNLLRNKFYDANGNLYNWNSNFHNNPFWLQEDNPEHDLRNRLIASASATYQVTPWLSATLRSGQDYYDWTINRDYAKGNIQYSDANYAGAFADLNQYNSENNTDLLLNATKDVTSHLTVTGLLGGTRRYAEHSSNNTYTSGISVPGVYNVSNAAISPTVTQFRSQRQVNSVYGSASFTWDGWWTVEGTARNDWSSTLPKGHNSYFYPGVNTSIVLTNAIPSLKSKVLSYAKLRGAFARVGNDAAPYQLATTYTGRSTQFGSLPQFDVSNNIANANLKPELTTSTEVGAELGFFDNRVTLDASYYDKQTKNQILNLVVSPASGFNTQSINAGQIQNKGMEATLTATPVITQSGFTWTTTFNFAQNRSKVVALYPGLKTVVLGGDWSANIEARAGEPYGTIFGNTYLRDSATGELLLHNGLPQIGPRKVLGDVNPDWTGGWNNQFKYKHVSLSFLFDIHQGGDIFSITNMMCEQSGVCASTLRGREVDWDKPGIVVKGIDEDTHQPNSTRVTSERYFQSKWLIHEAYIYDDSYIKLREARIGYDLPERFANMVHASAVNLSLVGRNLWTHKKVPNIDPEFSYSTGNVQGLEFVALPVNRSFGITLQVTP